MPALGYILLWLILVVWLLPTITLFLDKFRIPTLSSILLVSFIVTKIFGSDYYYDLVEPNNQTVEKRIPTAKTAYKKWSESHQKPNRAIVITVSGGGITAAFWTSLVFTELERALGPKFSSSVLLISSTSGGSVGSMYIVAQYGPDGLRQDRLGEIVKDAGSSRAFSDHSGSYPELTKKFAHSVGVNSSMISAMAAQRSSTVRAAAFLSNALSFEKACSMGLKSGE